MLRSIYLIARPGPPKMAVLSEKILTNRHRWGSWSSSWGKGFSLSIPLPDLAIALTYYLTAIKYPNLWSLHFNTTVPRTHLCLTILVAGKYFRAFLHYWTTPELALDFKMTLETASLWKLTVLSIGTIPGSTHQMNCYRFVLSMIWKSRTPLKKLFNENFIKENIVIVTFFK